MDFYSNWSNYRLKEEYLALDVTSTSSYSELIDDVEFGYNRDNEKLEQINVCMLMGEISILPIFVMNYQGSLNDVKNITTNINILSSITKCKEFSFVMDKGFFSKRNIDFLLKNYQNTRFLISLPLTCNLATDQLLKFRNSIFSPSNSFAHNDNILYSTSDFYNWNFFRKLNIFNFFNASKNLSMQEKYTQETLKLLRVAEKDPMKYKNNSEYLKFLAFNKIKGADSYTVSLSFDKILSSSNKSGWVSLITNDNIDYLQAINIYRDKDIVEKGFLKLKKDLDLYRTRVKSQDALNNKIFISFIALILLSKIHQVMLKSDLYKKYTITKLINTLKRFKKITINNDIIYNAVTKSQREIFNAFNIKIDQFII